MFEKRFCEWLQDSLQNEIPLNVRGFAFNLFEVSSSQNQQIKFAVELIGTSEFSEDNPDWPCAEVFEASPRSLEIPATWSGLTWEECLDAITALAHKFIGSHTLGASKLSAVDGVGVGFVDGDLRILNVGGP